MASPTQICYVALTFRRTTLVKRGALVAPTPRSAMLYVPQSTIHKGVIICCSSIRVIKGDTRSLDYGLK